MLNFKNFEMNRKDLAIVTISWARNDEEEDLLKRSLTQLSKFDIPVYITDGGSSETFLQYISNLPNIKLLQPVKGLLAQVRNSLEAGYESRKPFVFYTEPDKAAFFSQSLQSFLTL